MKALLIIIFSFSIMSIVLSNDSTLVNEKLLTEQEYIAIVKQYHPISLQAKNIYGCQFHPEKSQKAGLSIFNQFANL